MAAVATGRPEIGGNIANTFLGVFVDNENGYYDGLRKCVEHVGIELQRASCVETAMRALRERRHHIVLVNYDAVGNDTFELCRSLNSDHVEAILIILMSKVVAPLEEKLFDNGAYDVVVGIHRSEKVLSKRITAHLNHCATRRYGGRDFVLGKTAVDFGRDEVHLNGTVRRLPGILKDLLRYFIQNPGRTISRTELEQSAIWVDSVCTPADEGGKTFDVNVGKLRKIIEENPSEPKIIETVRGIGWRLALDAIKKVDSIQCQNC